MRGSHTIRSVDATGATFRVGRTEQSSSALRWHGHWTTTSSTAAFLATRTAGRIGSGASVSYRFSGRAVGWVATVGGGFGKAKVFIDGTYVRTVDLRQAASSRRIVFAKAWASNGDAHDQGRQSRHARTEGDQRRRLRRRQVARPISLRGSGTLGSGPRPSRR